MSDATALAETVGLIVRGYVERALSPLLQRLAAIEAVKPVDGEPGKQGEPGADGKDGLGFDDMTVEHDGERGVLLKFQRGDVVKEFPLNFDVVLDRGVYKAEQQYAKGDAVTWGGSLWIAQKATDAKPDSGDGWRLAVKRGRDGKDKA
jgi:integrin beta 3